MLSTETKIEKHLATGKKLKYTNSYHERYSAGGDMALVNSLFGSKYYGDGKWQGFQGKDMEVIIDLSETTEVSGVGVNCLQNTNSWIIFPKQVEVYGSQDGLSYSILATVENEIPAEIATELIQTLKTKFESTATRYIKVVAKNYGPLPDWHSGAGKDSWLFVDEIIVE